MGSHSSKTAASGPSDEVRVEQVRLAPPPQAADRQFGLIAEADRLCGDVRRLSQGKSISVSAVTLGGLLAGVIDRLGNRDDAGGAVVRGALARCVAAFEEVGALIASADAPCR